MSAVAFVLRRGVSMMIDVALLLPLFIVLSLLGFIQIIEWSDRWSVVAGGIVAAYFVWWEYRRQGQTPGRRLMHLRLQRADGGPLSVFEPALRIVVFFVVPVGLLVLTQLVQAMLFVEGSAASFLIDFCEHFVLFVIPVSVLFSPQRSLIDTFAGTVITDARLGTVRPAHRNAVWIAVVTALLFAGGAAALIDATQRRIHAAGEPGRDAVGVTRRATKGGSVTMERSETRGSVIETPPELARFIADPITRLIGNCETLNVGFSFRQSISPYPDTIPSPQAPFHSCAHYTVHTKYPPSFSETQTYLLEVLARSMFSKMSLSEARATLLQFTLIYEAPAGLFEFGFTQNVAAFVAQFDDRPDEFRIAQPDNALRFTVGLTVSQGWMEPSGCGIGFAC